MRIFPENLATFVQKKIVKKSREEIFANLIQTMTSEAGVLNPKALGGVACVGCEAPTQNIYFLAEWIKYLTFYFFQVAKFT